MTAAARRVRYARPDEAAGLNEFARNQFVATFADANTAADMQAYCAAEFTAAAMRERIESRSHGVLVVDGDSEPAGYALLETVEAGATLEIKRFYIAGRWHGSGLARQLMSAVEDHALALGQNSLVLGVWEHNPRAIRYYEKCGFSVCGAQDFMLGSDRQRDLIMRHELTGTPPDDATFVHRFLGQDWPPAAWTHEAHVRLAWTLVGEHGMPGAVDVVRAAIQQYNRHVLGREEAYHDTMTRAFVHIVAAERRDNESFGDFCRRRPDLLSRKPLAVGRYYSADVLKSDAARAGFVAPDLAPLPALGPADAGADNETRGLSTNSPGKNEGSGNGLGTNGSAT